jgi:pilus assembly protein CpaF
MEIPSWKNENPTGSNSARDGASELVREFGKLAPLISDPSIEEIWLNSPHRIFVARHGVSELTNIVLNKEEVRELVERLLMWGGRRLDLSHPFVDARLPDGSRLHVAIPEVTAKHWAVNIRKHLVRGKSLKELAQLGVMSPEVAHFLERAVRAGLNILVSGSTQAGKTTLLNALVSSVPFHNRVITVEEVFELKPQLPDCIALQTRPANLQGEGEIPLRRLIKESLRMRPTQLVVGEIREAESLDLLIALNSGLPGMATIHANSARDAISKLQTLPLLAGENISHVFIAPMVAQSIDLVVHTTILRNSGSRKITEIAMLTGRVEGERVESEPLFTYREGHGYEIGLGDPERILERARL